MKMVLRICLLIYLLLSVGSIIIDSATVLEENDLIACPEERSKFTYDHGTKIYRKLSNSFCLNQESHDPKLTSQKLTIKDNLFKEEQNSSSIKKIYFDETGACCLLHLFTDKKFIIDATSIPQVLHLHKGKEELDIKLVEQQFSDRTNKDRLNEQSSPSDQAKTKQKPILHIRNLENQVKGYLNRHEEMKLQKQWQSPIYQNENKIKSENTENEQLKSARRSEMHKMRSNIQDSRNTTRRQLYLGTTCADTTYFDRDMGVHVPTGFSTNINTDSTCECSAGLVKKEAIQGSDFCKCADGQKYLTPDGNCLTILGCNAVGKVAHLGYCMLCPAGSVYASPNKCDCSAVPGKTFWSVNKCTVREVNDVQVENDDYSDVACTGGKSYTGLAVKETGYYEFEISCKSGTDCLGDIGVMIEKSGKVRAFTFVGLTYEATVQMKQWDGGMDYITKVGVFEGEPHQKPELDFLFEDMFPGSFVRITTYDGFYGSTDTFIRLIKIEDNGTMTQINYDDDGGPRLYSEFFAAVTVRGNYILFLECYSSAYCSAHFDMKVILAPNKLDYDTRLDAFRGIMMTYDTTSANPQIIGISGDNMYDETYDFYLKDLKPDTEIVVDTSSSGPGGATGAGIQIAQEDGGSASGANKFGESFQLGLYKVTGTAGTLKNISIRLSTSPAGTANTNIAIITPQLEVSAGLTGGVCLPCSKLEISIDNVCVLCSTIVNPITGYINEWALRDNESNNCMNDPAQINKNVGYEFNRVKKYFECDTTKFRLEESAGSKFCICKLETEVVLGKTCFDCASTSPPSSPNADFSNCVCPSGSTFDVITKTCKCAPGFFNGPEGCTLDCPLIDGDSGKTIKSIAEILQ